MTGFRSNVRFRDRGGRLAAVEVSRRSSRPIVSSLHAALVALGVVVTSYQVQPTSDGLEERLEFSSADGGELDGQLSESVKAAILPLALDTE